MREGFFKATGLEPNKPPQALIPQCGACGLYKTCISPKMPVSGEGRLKALLVGEAPGEDEDKKNLQFVGRTGSELRQTLSRVGIDMRKDCWLYNALICRPPDNRKPTPKEIGYCQPNLRRTIEQLKPEIIIPLGDTAVKSLLTNSIWKEKVGKIGRWVGFRIPCQKPNAWICPTWHPSHIVRLKDKAADFLFEEHLRGAFELEGRPWKYLPRYQNEIEVIVNVDEAAQAIARLIDDGQGPMAFDLETDRLKPDHKDASIICCSISNGVNTIAFPWEGAVIEQMRRFVLSKIKKIASNIKFEDRWIWRILGLRVRRWWWDTMLAAHWSDARPDITGLKFQSFVHLGAHDYNYHIEKYLDSAKKGGNEPNRIRQLAIRDILQYCGMDSLFEWLIGTKQMEEVGYAA